MSGLSDFLEKQQHINTNLTSSNSLIQGSLHSLPSRQENPLRSQSQSVFSMLLIISKLATFWVRFTKRKREKKGKEKRKEERSRENTTGIKGNRAAPAGGARGDPGYHPGLLVPSESVSLISLYQRDLPLCIHRSPTPTPTAARTFHFFLLSLWDLHQIIGPNFGVHLVRKI